MVDDEKELREALRESGRQVNLVYEERNRVVAVLTRLAQLRGWRVWLGKHEPADDPAWDHEWTTVVFIEVPTLGVGQVSWHIHDRDLHLFEHVPTFVAPYVDPGSRILTDKPPSWDGHTTAEKYERLRRFCEMTASEIMNPPGTPGRKTE